MNTTPTKLNPEVELESYRIVHRAQYKLIEDLQKENQLLKEQIRQAQEILTKRTEQ